MGLGSMAANLLLNQGHEVVLHARNAERGRQALEKVPGAEKVLIADLVQSRRDQEAGCGS